MPVTRSTGAASTGSGRASRSSSRVSCGWRWPITRPALPRGALIKLYFGGGKPGFGLPPTTPSLAAYLSLLEGSDLPWSVAVLGGDVLATIAEEAVRRGGHLRVGLEDFAGERRPSNVELVQEAVALVRRLGHRPATIDEAAQILGLAAR